jgi:hypothetical protein
VSLSKAFSLLVNHLASEIQRAFRPEISVDKGKRKSTIKPDKNPAQKFGISNQFAEGKHLSPPRGKFGIHRTTPTGQKIYK